MTIHYDGSVLIFVRKGYFHAARCNAQTRPVPLSDPTEILPGRIFETTSIERSRHDDGLYMYAGKELLLSQISHHDRMTSGSSRKIGSKNFNRLSNMYNYPRRLRPHPGIYSSSANIH